MLSLRMKIVDKISHFPAIQLVVATNRKDVVKASYLESKAGISF